MSYSLDVDDTWKNYYQPLGGEGEEFRIDGIWYSRKKVYKSLNWKNRQEFQEYFMTIDTLKIKREMDDESDDKTYDFNYTSFTDFQTEHAELHNITIKWWYDYVNIHEYTEDYLKENNSEYFGIVWDDREGCWEEAYRIDEQEYDVCGTKIVRFE